VANKGNVILKAAVSGSGMPVSGVGCVSELSFSMAFSSLSKANRRLVPRQFLLSLSMSGSALSFLHVGVSLMLS